MSRRRPFSESRWSTVAVVALGLVALAGAVVVINDVPSGAERAADSTYVSHYTPPAEQPDNPDTVFMGDSVTQGDTPSFEATPGSVSWVRYAIEDTRSPWAYTANVAVGGQTTAQMLARFDRDVLARHPGAVVILGGTNDMGQSVPVSVTLDNLRQMVTRAQSAGADAYLVSLPPNNATPDRALALAAAEKHLATQLDVPFADIQRALGRPDGSYRPGMTADGTHPSKRGAQRLAAAVLTAFGLD